MAKNKITSVRINEEVFDFIKSKGLTPQVILDDFIDEYLGDSLAGYAKKIEAVKKATEELKTLNDEFDNEKRKTY